MDYQLESQEAAVEEAVCLLELQQSWNQTVHCERRRWSQTGSNSDVDDWKDAVSIQWEQSQDLFEALSNNSNIIIEWTTGIHSW